MAEPTEMHPTSDVYLSPYEPKVEHQEAQQITVYKDPHFSTDPEDATAVLEKKILQSEQRELWRVTLTSGVTVLRWIKKEIAVV